MENYLINQDPFVSEKLPISDLEKDFINHDVYLGKLKLLKDNYRFLRRIRRDGSCFYRAYGFALLENLMKLSNEENGQRQFEAKRLKGLCEKHRAFLVREANYPDFTVGDFCENFIELIDGVADGSINSYDLMLRFNNGDYSNFYVSFLRLLVSAYLQENADYYCHFVDDAMGLKEFCSQQVEPMVQEADNIQLMALASALDSPLRIANCQLHGPLQILTLPEEAATKIKIISSGVEDKENANAMQPVNKSFVDLLYRPGHYDVLYK